MSSAPKASDRNDDTQREEQRRADQLRVRGVDDAAPEVVPADDREHQRDEVGGVAEQLVRQLGR